MISMIFTDDNGFTIVSGPQSVSGHFVAAPVPAVITDAGGKASSSFTRAPISAKQTDEFGFNSGVFYSHPIAVAQTDARGYSVNSGHFIGSPISIVSV